LLDSCQKAVQSQNQKDFNAAEQAIIDYYKRQNPRLSEEDVLKNLNG
jgi:hypothetical protein